MTFLNKTWWSPIRVDHRVHQIWGPCNCCISSKFLGDAMYRVILFVLWKQKLLFTPYIRYSQIVDYKFIGREEFGSLISSNGMINEFVSIEKFLNPIELDSLSLGLLPEPSTRSHQLSGWKLKDQVATSNRLLRGDQSLGTKMELSPPKSGKAQTKMADLIAEFHHLTCGSVFTLASSSAVTYGPLTTLDEFCFCHWFLINEGPNTATDTTLCSGVFLAPMMRLL